MDLIQQRTITADTGTRARLLTALVIATAVLAIVAAGIVALTTGSGRTSAVVARLSPQQIVTRSEIQSRYAAQAAPARLSPQQIVTRSEIQSRYAAQAAPARLSPQQIVIRSEIQSRYAAQAAPAGLSPQQIVTRGEVQDRLGGK